MGHLDNGSENQRGREHAQKDTGVIHVLYTMKWTKQHHAIQDRTQFKTWELLITGMFHLIFSAAVDTGNYNWGELNCG